MRVSPYDLKGGYVSVDGVYAQPLPVVSLIRRTSLGQGTSIGMTVHSPRHVWTFCAPIRLSRSSTRMRSMAVQLQLLVTSGTRDQFDELDARVGRAMSDGGGPPPGLMSHVGLARRRRIRHRRGLAYGI